MMIDRYHVKDEEMESMMMGSSPDRPQTVSWRKYLCAFLCLIATSTTQYALSKNGLSSDPSNSSGHDSSLRPVALLHFGPRKTATSTIQRVITEMAAELSYDGFSSPGLCPKTYPDGARHYLHECKLGYRNFDPSHQDEKNKCLEQSAASWEDLVEQVHQNFHRGQSLFLSDEDIYHLAIESNNNTAFLAELERLTRPYHPNRYVTITYRDYPEWIVSQYRQFNSFKYTNKRRLVGFVDWFRVEQLARPYFLLPINKEQVEHYSNIFGHLQIFNMHDLSTEKDGLLVAWFCHIAPWALTTCQTLRDQAKAKHQPTNETSGISDKVNESDHHQPALILALQHLNMTRVKHKEDQKLVLETKEVIATWLETTNDFLPRRCLSSAEQADIWKRSVELRQWMVPDYDRDNVVLPHKFQIAQQMGDFCQFNYPAIAVMDSWKSLWKKR
jgi:hypothetical protein